ncbi:MAG: ABC transporter ATP-binding protein [Betaproteobacteria bacterium]|nr:ABC transporter ATP-binding protein [Betaproteobacteria bacterium]
MGHGAVGIEIAGVSKVFPGIGALGSVTALGEVSLAIAAGEFVSILGPSGCGKSTLLRCIAGLERPSAGSIRVGGEEVTRPPEQLGMVFQRDALLEWRSVLDNLMLPIDFRHGKRGAYMERARDLLSLFGLSEFAQRYPSELSGGMRQRASICRALIDDPALLLMDEPFGALDALTRDQLNIELQRMWLSSHKTVAFVTHSIIEAVFLADRVVVFTPRPGAIADILDIDIPRPRRLAVRGSPQFVAYVDRIRQLFENMGLFKEEA